MAESQHDDLADALARMANGDVAPSEHEPPAPLQEPIPQPPIKPVSPVRPITAAKASPARSPQSAAPAAPAKPAAPARPAAPLVRSPAPTTASPKASPQARPARPTAQAPVGGVPANIATPRPAALAAVGSPARPQRPTAPSLQQATAPADTQQPADIGLSTGLQVPEIFDDEDAVIVPAPEPSAFIPKPKPATTADFRARAAARQRLEFKRTMIPVLLTLGVWMFVFAAMRFCLGPDSPLTTLPVWVPVILIVAGCILMTFAVLNMLSVRAELAGIEGKRR